MSTKEKDGRPPRSIAAWRSLHAQSELKGRFPMLAGLIDMLAIANVDPAAVTAKLEKALREIRKGANRSFEPLPPKAGLAERRLHAAAEIERLAQDQAALQAASGAVSAELAAVDTAISRADAELLRLSLERDPEDAYLLDIAGPLRAAGLTAATRRRFTPPDILKIASIIDATKAPKASVPSIRFQRRKAKIGLAWRPDNPWLDLQPDGYSVTTHTLDRATVDVDTLLRCGLPPFSNMEEFGYPALVRAFHDARDPRAKWTECWRICAKWIADNIDDSGFDAQALPVVRRRAWGILLGTKYGFARHVDELSQAQMLSPWDKNAFVRIKRDANR